MGQSTNHTEDFEFRIKKQFLRWLQGCYVCLDCISSRIHSLAHGCGWQADYGLALFRALMPIRGFSLSWKKFGGGGISPDFRILGPQVKPEGTGGERRKGGKRKYGRKRGKGKRKRWTKGTCTSALTHIFCPFSWENQFLKREGRSRAKI